MSDGEMKIQELDATIAGQKVRLTGANLNTLFTVLGFIGTCVLGYVLYMHTAESKEVQNSFVAALKELTVAQRDGTAAAREQNCLISIPEAQRESKAEFCKRVTR